MCEEGKDGSWDSQLHALNGIIPSNGWGEAVEEGGEEDGCTTAYVIHEE